MSQVTKVFGLIRVIVLALVSLFSALVLVMAALVTSYSVPVLGGYFPWAAFALAIGFITLVTVPVMIALSIFLKGAFTSMIVVELSYVCLLWILWLSVGGTIGNLEMINYCSAIGSNAGQSACMETQAMVAFSFLNWLLLMGLNIFLFTLVVIQANRGNSAIWTSCVTSVDYGAPGRIEQKAAYGAVPTQYSQTPQQFYPQSAPNQQYAQPVPNQQYAQPVPNQQYPQPIPNQQQQQQPVLNQQYSQPVLNQQYSQPVLNQQYSPPVMTPQQMYPPQQMYASQPQQQQPGMPMV
jgi:hypothetical protein